MSRENSPFICGDYWLDKRRDGKSPDIWQIARYSETSRSVVYRSTKRGAVGDAEQVLRSYEAEQRSRKPQSTGDAELLPHLFNYLREHGPDVIRLDTIKSSFRAWIGFLMQDELTTGARVSDIHKVSVARFRRWRMAPHGYEVEWGGRMFRHASTGVTGETVQRNIEDLRSALYHAEAAGRIVAPKIPSVDKKLRSRPRDTVLTPKQLGAIWAYAREDVGAWRWIALMLGTAARPGQALGFDPAVNEWDSEALDLLKPGEAETEKRKAVVPTIAPLVPILTEWRSSPHQPVRSRKRWWRTMRRALAVSASVDPYAIRHTLATFMDNEGVPGAELSGIAGHTPSHRGLSRTTSKHYLHYDPRTATKAKRALTKFFRMCEAEAEKWAADHLRTIDEKGRVIIVAREAVKC
jgi:integrase